MPRKKKQKERKLERRKKDLVLRVQGLRYLAIGGVVLWILFFLSLFIIPERSSAFQVVWGVYFYIFGLMLLTSMSDYANTVSMTGETGREAVAVWSRICFFVSCAGALIMALFYIMFYAVPGMAFILFALPFGCFVSFLIFNHDCKSDRPLNWGLMAFWSGSFAFVFLLILCALSYFFWDVYDARYALGMFGTPLLIFSIITGVRAWKRHCERIEALPEPESEEPRPVLRIITGGLYKKPEKTDETGDGDVEI